MYLIDKILKYQKFFFFAVMLFFLMASLYMALMRDMWYFSAFAVALPFIFIAVYAYDKLLMIVALLTPFSLQLSYFIGDRGIDLSLPTEPILVILMLIFFIKLVINPHINNKLLFHPITLAIFFNFLWILLTTMTSELPVISFKFLISRLWFVIPCFFLSNQMFKEYDRMKNFIILYAVGLAVVIIYTTFNHLQYSFLSQSIANTVMQPFYNDHTAYGSILALFLPVLVGLLVWSESSKKLKILLAALTTLLLIGLVLSYSRAAWLSVIGAIMIWIAVLLRIKFKYLIGIAAFLIVAFLIFQHAIIDSLEKNNQDSSDNLTEHVQSISNISTDASNMERLNRWNSAFEMFYLHPILGWGPGTYSFVYAPFQRSKDKTIISTNFGEVGNAHSEYIGPLAESGILGSLSFIIIMIFTIITGIKNYRIATNRDIKALSLSITLGLITYFVHGTLNNFLDTDKLAVPFWTFISIIVAIDIYHKEKEKIIN